MINESSYNIREKREEIYKDDEIKWNNTYLNQLKNLNISIIEKNVKISLNHEK